jgi:hypothetical protein
MKVLLNQNNKAVIILNKINILTVYFLYICVSPLAYGERSVNPVCLNFAPVHEYQMLAVNRFL